MIEGVDDYIINGMRVGDMDKEQQIAALKQLQKEVEELRKQKQELVNTLTSQSKEAQDFAPVNSNKLETICEEPVCLADQEVRTLVGGGADVQGEGAVGKAAGHAI